MRLTERYLTALSGCTSTSLRFNDAAERNMARLAAGGRTPRSERCLAMLGGYAASSIRIMATMERSMTRLAACVPLLEGREKDLVRLQRAASVAVLVFVLTGCTSPSKACGANERDRWTNSEGGIVGACRLGSISPDHLLLMAREWCAGDWNFNESSAHFVKVLGSASSRGNEEASWLLGVLTEQGAVPEFETLAARLEWLAKLMIAASPRAMAYRGSALSSLGRYEEAVLLKTSADAGYAPAMAAWGDLLLDLGFYEIAIQWIMTAVNLNDPCGYEQLAFCYDHGEGLQRDEEKALVLYRKGKSYRQATIYLILETAAELGSAKSMLALSDKLGARGDWIDFAMWRARSIAYSATACNADAFDTDFLEQRIALLDGGSANSEVIQILFVIGRELDGVDQFWDTNKKITPEWQRCVDVYLAVMHCARVAALYTVFAMKTRVVGGRRIGRDVATLLAKMVYATRQQATAWYRRNCDVILNSQRCDMA
jgi:TPR repeat protein